MSSRATLLGRKKISTQDRPTRIDDEGTQYWESTDGLHRLNGPAVICSNGDQEYWTYGFRHREGNLPALKKGARTEYWLYGVRHRSDGPAVIDTDRESYWRDGKHIKTLTTHADIKAVTKIDGRFKTIEKQGILFHYKNDRLHRETGPAVEPISPEGTLDEKFYLNGVLYELEDWEKKLKTSDLS